MEFITLFGPILGVIAGSVGTILVTWISKHYEEQSAYRKMIIDTSMEYYRETLIAARGSRKITYVWPYESFVISIAHLVNKVVRKDFKVGEIDNIVKENKKLISALEKLYSTK